MMTPNPQQHAQQQPPTENMAGRGAFRG